MATHQNNPHIIQLSSGDTTKKKPNPFILLDSIIAVSESSSTINKHEYLQIDTQHISLTVSNNCLDIYENFKLTYSTM
jgi:hypothetical protein